MGRIFIAVTLLALTGCSVVAPHPGGVSPCDAGEASYQCQVERYQNVNAD
jgi:outer membrane biogenesis lipoprotein LolB